jgi:hypothetical protein
MKFMRIFFRCHPNIYSQVKIFGNVMMTSAVPGGRFAVLSVGRDLHHFGP